MNKIINTINTVIFVLAILLPIPLIAESPDDLVVFVNTKSSVATITPEELKQIFLKKRTRWPGGDKIDCINSPEGSAERTLFRNKILGMSKTEETTYWQNQKLRMQLSPPIQISNTTKAVFRLKRSVGYAFRKNVPKGVVRIILVVP